jgi:translation initiation factor IF-2
MSTKDLLERLQRTAQSRPVRKAAPRTGDTGSKSGAVQTRVGSGVIRRRAKDRKKERTAEVLPTPAEPTRVTPSRVIRRPAATTTAPVAETPAAASPVAATAAPAPEVAAKPADAAPATAAPADAAPATAAPADAAPTTAAPTTAAPTTAAPATAAPADAAPATAAPATAAPAAETATQAAPTATPETATAEASGDSATSASPSEASVTAAPSPDTASPAVAAESAAADSATPAAETAAAPADASATPVADADAAAPAEAASAATDAPDGDTGPSAAAEIAAGLPRADGSRPNAPVEGRRPLPGLGLGVIAPPPGYDPADPTGNRARAQRAAEAARAERERQSAPAGPKVWRDEQPAAGPAGAARGRRPAARRGGAPAGPARKSRGRGRRMDMFDGGAGMRRRRGKGKSGPKKASPQAKALKRRVEMDETITVAQLSHGMAVKVTQVIKALMGMGQMATANDPLDFDTAQLIATEFEYEVINAAFQEDEHLIQHDESDEDNVVRPPVVTIMGHVDHGKTTLLDQIRKANVADGEAGGITQHVSAYQVERHDELITFIDTPGHAAFTAMRARGAQCTDIVVLVVAADDGVMPQTIEVINHAKAADVEIIVALNKCDRAESDPARVRQQLLEYELISEEYGGETLMVDVSAKTGKGIDDLLDAILLVSELAEYSANPDRHAEGTVIEARVERGRGPVATILVQEGTMRQGDRIVVGEVWGRVRAITDSNGKRMKTAGPSTPVEIIGLNDVPAAGDNAVVVANDKAAKTLAGHRAETTRQHGFSQNTRVTLEDLMAMGAAGEVLALNLIIKTDVNGSLEALLGSFNQLSVEGTDIKILHAAVGAVSESDVTLAHTNNGVIIGFNVRPDAKARRAADSFGVQVRTYKVIYEAIEDVEKALKGLLGPTIEEKVQGTAELRQTFSVPKIGTVAGCMVTEGTIARPHQIRLLRDGVIVWEGRLGSLRRFKDDVRDVSKGFECGMNLDGFNDIKVGDIIEAYTREEVPVI